MELKEVDHILTISSPVESLSQYLEAVNLISHKFSNNLWFRGHSKDSHKNIPTIYRPETWLKSKYDYVDEHEIFKKFKHRSSFKNRSDYEYYHLMQHYGLPTRLLDWTGSSLIGLFFAIHKHDCCVNPRVWVLNPWSFNFEIHSEKTVYYFFEPKVHPKVIEYLNPSGGMFINMPEQPIAIEPSFNDDRVIAQKSGFILFGKNQTPIDSLIKEGKHFQMARIDIKSEAAYDMLIDLVISGIDYHSIFPDNEGLVKEIKRKWDLK